MNPDFNQSRDFPWDRSRLQSRELFDAFAHVARHGGVPIATVAGGTVFDVERETNQWVQVWTTPTEVIVAYPSFADRYRNSDVTEERFETWIPHLRGSDPLPLGHTRGYSSYGATCAPESDVVPVLKWASRGDWMFVCRDWPVLDFEWERHSRDPNRLLVALGEHADVRKRRLLFCAFARRIWDSIPEVLVRHLIVTTEALYDGTASEAEFHSACAVVNEQPNMWRNHLLGSECWRGHPVAVASFAVRAASDRAHQSAIGRGASEAIATEEEFVAWTAEEQAQCDLLREVFGNPHRPVRFDPAWRTDTSVAIARQMYDSRDFGAMPILADALQDAGCDSDELLNHCRSATATHVRGCWVVDLVLGKG
jgi:hypothetical protein